MKSNIPIATIATTRPDHARANLLLVRTSEGIEIQGITPDGPETPAFPAFATCAAALDAIAAAYGGPEWRLEWDEMGCQFAERLDAGRGVDPVTLAAELYGGHAGTASAPGSWIITFGGDHAQVAATHCASWLSLALRGEWISYRPAANGHHQVWIGVA